jgi:DNA polymerase I-like protein with 3'-5' exonuclease and polymerase domains
MRLKNNAANVCNELPIYGNLNRPEILIVMDPKIGDGIASMGASPISKADYRMIGEHLASFGIKQSTVAIVSCAKPICMEDFKREKKLSAHLKDNRGYFVDIVNHLKPRLIIGLGKNATRQITGRATQITKVRGIPTYSTEFSKAILLPIFSTSHVRARPELQDTFRSDIQTASMIVKSGYVLDKAFNQVKAKYRWCTDIGFLLKNPPKRISADTETLGMDYYKPETKLLTIQLCWKAGEAIAIPLEYVNGNTKTNNIKKRRLVAQLKELFENPNIEFFGHNFKYDFLFLKYKLGITVANYAHDTLLLMHCIDENMLNKSLDDCVRRFVPAMSGYNDILNRDPEHEGKSRMDLFGAEKMLGYACGDADACFRLFGVLHKLLSEDKKAYNSYQRVTLPAMRAFCDVEPEGFTIDVEALKSFEKTLEAHQKLEYRRLMAMIPRSIKQEFADTGVGLKLGRAELLRAMLFTHKDGLKLKPLVFTKTSSHEKEIPSVSTKQHLPYFIQHPFVAGITDYIKNDKLLTTYVKGFYKYIYEGRIHPSYLLHGTVTGRSASRNPNGQNFPKRGKLAKEYRKIFIAPPGWTLVESDFSQIELRVAAILSREPAMLKVYQDGGDIHEMTAAGVMGIPLEQFKRLPDAIREQKRFQAKAVNFGFIYGMWWRKFKVYAKTEYGIEFTDKEAERIRQAYFRTYKNIEPWHTKTIDFAKRYGYVRSIDGRVRHLTSVFSPDEGIAKQAQRQGINSPVQCFANSLGLMALARLNAEMSRDKVKLVGFIHDALVLLVKDEYLMDGCRDIKRYMESNPLQEWFGFTPPIPILADVSIGKNLSTMYALGKYKDVFANKSIVSLKQFSKATGVDFAEKVTVNAPATRVKRKFKTRFRKLKINV